MSAANGGTLLTLYGNSSIFFQGDAPGSLTADNFVLDNSIGAASASNATPSPAEPRGFVGTDASGVAHGTAGADDIFASGAGQTLIGGGDDDIFHIGTNTDAIIQETNPGISTVETWASSYTLPDPVDNLIALGDYAHALTGNGAANVITGSAGNDVIDGHGGSDLMTGGGGHDTFVFGTNTAPSNDLGGAHITDFNPVDDVLDMRALVSGPFSFLPPGSDPLHDGWVTVLQDPGGSAEVIFRNGVVSAGGFHFFGTVVTLDHVAPSSLTDANFLFA